MRLKIFDCNLHALSIRGPSKHLQHFVGIARLVAERQRQRKQKSFGLNKAACSARLLASERHGASFSGASRSTEPTPHGPTRDAAVLGVLRRLSFGGLPGGA